MLCDEGEQTSSIPFWCDLFEWFKTHVLGKADEKGKGKKEVIQVEPSILWLFLKVPD